MVSLQLLEASEPGWKPIVQRKSPLPGRRARSSENDPVRWPQHKVLLINPPYLNVYRKLNVGRNYTFPLGLGYVASVLREAGFPVDLLDPEPMGMDWSSIGSYLQKASPMIVGITSATASFTGAIQIARLVRQNTNALTVLGGPHGSALPEYTLHSQAEFDVVVIGEGECTMRELCLAVAQGETDFSRISGIAYRHAGRAVRTGLRPLNEDLDVLPVPARDMTDISLYRIQVDRHRGTRSATVCTSRGCPARCTFCAVGVTMGHGFRVHSPEYVLSEIKELQDRWEIRHIVFVDDEFTVGRTRAEELCKAIIDSGLKFDWHCFSRVNDITPGLLKLMQEAGCTSVLYGIESGDERVLKLMKKGSSLANARRAVQYAHDLGMKIQAGFIIGSYGDTHESIRRTIDFACELNPTIASFNIMVPLPGTEDWNRMVKVIPEALTDWDNFTTKALTPIIQLEGLSRQDLIRYTYNAYLRFYGRPSQIWRILKTVSSIGHLWAYMRGAFGLARQILAWRRQSKKKDTGPPLDYPFSSTL